MGKLTLLLGGARSGKSTYAQRLAVERAALPANVLYIATARSLDDEMETRIAVHRRDRPVEWQIREIPTGLSTALAGQLNSDRLVLLDCLTMLVTNLILDVSPDIDAPDEEAAAQVVEAEIDGLIGLIKQAEADWIIVSNEVGLGLVPPYPLGRLYRDLLGRANQQLAAFADEVFFLVAGIPMPIHSFR